MVEDRHAPTGSASFCQGGADSAHADNAERLAVQILPQVADRFPGFPPAFARVEESFAESPGRGDQEHERVIGRGVGQSAGRIADADSASRGGRHIDVVEPDCEVAYDLKPWSGVQQFAVDAIGQKRNQAVAIGDLAFDDVVRRRQLLGPNLGVAGFFDPAQADFRNAASDENAGKGHKHSEPGVQSSGDHRFLHNARVLSGIPEHRIPDAQRSFQICKPAWGNLKLLRGTTDRPGTPP